MVAKGEFRQYSQYEYALLRLLANMPDGGGRTKEVLREFEVAYRERIPESDYEVVRHGEVKWRNKVSFSRQCLKERGFLDVARTGWWHITDAGRRWLTDHANDDEMPPRLRRVETDDGAARTSRRRAASSGSKGITLEMLEETKKVMSNDQFRRVWGTLYEELLAAERSKTTTNISQTELGRRAMRKLEDVHTFLGGGGNTPGSELLCDWIQFCFMLDLSREAAALLQYVVADEVDPALFRRTKKSAEVSRTKLGW